LLGDPEAGALAAAHLSHVYFVMGDYAQALDFARYAVTRTSPQETFLRLLFAGMALERLGRLDEARTSYEEARRAVPAAQSGLLALATLNSRLGTAPEDVPREWFDAAVEDDPYRLYFYGDYMHWGTYIAAVREAVR